MWLLRLLKRWMRERKRKAEQVAMGNDAKMVDRGGGEMEAMGMSRLIFKPVGRHTAVSAEALMAYCAYGLYQYVLAMCTWLSLLRYRASPSWTFNVDESNCSPLADTTNEMKIIDHTEEVDSMTRQFPRSLMYFQPAHKDALGRRYSRECRCSKPLFFGPDNLE